MPTGSSDFFPRFALASPHVAQPRSVSKVICPESAAAESPLKIVHKALRAIEQPYTELISPAPAPRRPSFVAAGRQLSLSAHLLLLPTAAGQHNWSAVLFDCRPCDYQLCW